MGSEEASNLKNVQQVVVSKNPSKRSDKKNTPRRIIFPVIHDSASIYSNSSCSTQELDSKLSSANNGFPQKADLPTCIRRKTSSQSSLSVISEDGSYYLGPSELPKEKNIQSTSDSSSSLQSLNNNSLHPTDTSTCSIPSLISSNSLHGNNCINYSEHRRSHSSTCMCSIKTRHKCKGVSFDPRVWVHEYKPYEEELTSNNWYNANDIENFKRDATACIKEHETRYLSDFKLLGVFFNHPALKESLDFDKTEIRDILVIDPNKLFASLFQKGFQSMLPHASITIATSSNDALHKIKMKQESDCNKASHGFDIIVTEERLLPTIPMQQQYLHKNNQCSYDEHLRSSGSFLIQKLASERKDMKNDQFVPYTLLIGVTAHENEDRLKLCKSGADLVWKKPPPSMNAGLRNTLLRLIMEKRNLS